MSVDDEFQELQSKFFAKYCNEFEETDENKFSYTAIFEEYMATVEAYIEARLEAEIPGFDMEEFLAQIEARGEEEVCGDVFDLLLTFTDFARFKELMLDHKKDASGGAPPSPISSKRMQMSP
jgi:ADP-ribosylation factor 2-binding protein